LRLFKKGYNVSFYYGLTAPSYTNKERIHCILSLFVSYRKKTEKYFSFGCVLFGKNARFASQSFGCASLRIYRITHYLHLGVFMKGLFWRTMLCVVLFVGSVGVGFGQMTKEEAAKVSPQHHVIDEAEAKELIQRFQKLNPFNAWSFHAGTLPTRTFAAILAHPNAAFLGYYYAIDDAGAHQIIVCARTADGKDIITDNGVISPRRSNNPFALDSSHFLTVRTARKWIAAYRNNAAYKALGGECGGSIFKQSIIEMANQKGNDGIRMYFAANINNKPRVVLTGTNGTGTLENAAFILNRVACPPACEPERAFVMGCSTLAE
jgi:hypothetical protein